jgi:ubiquinone/menaquinone biosynthesis C-methylase UbiE
MKKFAIFLVLAAAASAQVAKEANERFRTPEGRREVSDIMMAHSRDVRQKPEALVAALEIKPGMTVADVGTGPGYMLPHLSAAVGPKGKIYAEDIFPDMIEAAKKYSGEKQLANVHFVLGNEKNAQLPANSVDLALVLDTYHHFDYPGEMLDSLRKALKPEGRLVIVEYHKNEKSMDNGLALKHIRGTEDEFVKEIEGFGFTTVSRKQFTPEVQWMAVFRKK